MKNQTILEDVSIAIDQSIKDVSPKIVFRDFGRVIEAGKGTATVQGLSSVKSEELVKFKNGSLGLALNLNPESISIVLLNEKESLQALDEVYSTGRVIDIPVGEGVLGRVMNGLGEPLDAQGIISFSKRVPIERIAPSIMERLPVTVPLQTGITAIDALIPIGRGQRELIIGDRQTGKTAIAVDTIINQKDKDVICIYCAIGKEASDVAKVIQDLKSHNAMDYSIVIVATGEDTAGLNYITPYAATSIGEHFMSQGKDVLVVYDDLSRHARAYRELSLLLRRPPAREAYPGDIFYVHSRLLERATHLKKEYGGGSLTALPIVETQAQNISAYIPTNLISITDGQIYLNPNLFQQGILPPVDIGKSVSRVGGKTQLAAYRSVAGDLRLSYSQFEELEEFARFGTKLDEQTKKTLERGKRVREVLKQKQYQPIPVPEQLAIILAVTEGVFDSFSLNEVPKIKEIARNVMKKNNSLQEKIFKGEKWSEKEKQNFLENLNQAVQKENSHGKT